MIISRDLFILGDEYFSVTSKSRYEMKNFKTNSYEMINFETNSYIKKEK